MSLLNRSPFRRAVSHVKMMSRMLQTSNLTCPSCMYSSDLCPIHSPSSPIYGIRPFRCLLLIWSILTYPPSLERKRDRKPNAPNTVPPSASRGLSPRRTDFSHQPYDFRKSFMEIEVDPRWSPKSTLPNSSTTVARNVHRFILLRYSFFSSSFFLLRYLNLFRPSPLPILTLRLVYDFPFY